MRNKVYYDSMYGEECNVELCQTVFIIWVVWVIILLIFSDFEILSLLGIIHFFMPFFMLIFFFYIKDSMSW